MERCSFSKLLYETYLDSSASKETVVNALSPLRDWIKRNIPSKLYRYRSDSKYSIAALEKDELWGSTILEFNDPYECTPCYDNQLLKECLQRMFDPDLGLQTILALKNHNLNIPVSSVLPADYLASFSQILQDLSEEAIEERLLCDYRKILDRIFDEWDVLINRFFMGIKSAESETHIACFSEINDSTLMWGHYADRHTGFCLEYDFASLLEDCRMNCDIPAHCSGFMLNYHIAPVTYSKERFDATRHLLTVIQDYIREVTGVPSKPVFLDTLLMAKCQLLKSDDWSYEREWRLTRREIKPQYEPYCVMTQLRPKALYLGSNMIPERELAIYEICQAKGIQCYKMLQNYVGRDFTLTAQPYEEYVASIKERIEKRTSSENQLLKKIYG